jgi:MurNAc alpha-1-phosphate uridylyltransferase
MNTAATIARLVLEPTAPTDVDVGMVLAAGRGTRLGALGRQRPKALMDVGGETLLDQALHGLAAGGVKRAVVNAAHLKEQIVDHLGGRTESLPIAVSEEDEPLETGGGVVKALPLLGEAPFFAVNADIWWADSLAQGLTALKLAWRPAAMDVLLLVLPTMRASGYEGRGDFYMDGVGALTRKHEAETAPFLFTGTQLLAPDAFKDAPAGAFSLNEIYDRAATAGRLFGISHSGGWTDVGTPARLAAARGAADPARQPRLL